MGTWDAGILQWFNGLTGHSQLFDAIVTAFTAKAPWVFGVFFAFCFFRRNEQPEPARRTILLSGLSGLLAIGITAVLGHLLYRARPFAALSPDQVHLLIPHAADSSFPSDHTMGSAAFAVGMWRWPGRSVRILFGATAVLVGLSRLAAGVHWPSDVAGSMILGTAVAQLVFACERPLGPYLDRVLGLVAGLERFVRSLTASESP